MKRNRQRIESLPLPKEKRESKSPPIWIPKAPLAVERRFELRDIQSNDFVAEAESFDRFESLLSDENEIARLAARRILCGAVDQIEIRTPQDRELDSFADQVRRIVDDTHQAETPIVSVRLDIPIVDAIDRAIKELEVLKDGLRTETESCESVIARLPGNHTSSDMRLEVNEVWRPATREHPKQLFHENIRVFNVISTETTCRNVVMRNVRCLSSTILIWQDGDTNREPPTLPPEFEEYDHAFPCLFGQARLAKVNSGFGWRQYPRGVKDYHPGVDLGVGAGTPVYFRAMGDGERATVLSAPNRGSGDSGVIIYVEYADDGEWSYHSTYQYWHLVPDPARKPGTPVKLGDRIGTVAEWDRPHLHLAGYQFFDTPWIQNRDERYLYALDPLNDVQVDPEFGCR